MELAMVVACKALLLSKMQSATALPGVELAGRTVAAEPDVI
jgi:hypothetical protein